MKQTERSEHIAWKPDFTGADADKADAYLRALACEPRDAPETDDRAGTTATDLPRVDIACTRVVDPALSQVPITGARHDEGYRIISEGDAARLEYTSDRGLRNAVATLARMRSEPLSTAQTTICDAPRFPMRGLIEGYYGPPWKPAERREIMRFMAAHKMNAYFYGPKDDPYHRSNWRESYPASMQAEIAGLVATAASLAIDFWYTIGPGLSMEYSNTDDLDRLVSKLHEVAELDISRFGLLFDDIPASLQHEADREAFASLPEAHATVAHRVFAALRERNPKTRLVVCPTQYWGAGNEAYITELGALLDPRIDVFWTGPEICSRELTLRDAALLERTIVRPPLYWDNYPVNDLEMKNELHIGPYRGRDPHLYRASIGVIANGMEYPESTKIGLATVADYLWNPEEYEPEASWAAALGEVVGARDAAAFVPFADCNRYSSLYTTDAPALADELERMGFLRATGRHAEARRVLGEAVERLHRSVDLFDHGMENTKLESEIAPWIAKYRRGVTMLQELFVELAKTEPDWTVFSTLADEYRADTTYTFADVLYGITEEFARGDS